MSTSIGPNVRSRDAMFRRNQERSPLLRLPAELRNRIYEYTLSGYTCEFQYGKTIDEIQAVWALANCTWSPRKQAEHAGALTQTCRQIRTETKLLMLKLNDIIVGGAELLLDLSNRLPLEESCAIRTLRLYVDMHWEIASLATWQYMSHDAADEYNFGKVLKEVPDLGVFTNQLLAKFTGIKTLIIEDGTYNFLVKRLFDVYVGGQTTIPRAVGVNGTWVRVEDMSPDDDGEIPDSDDDYDWYYDEDYYH